MLGSLVTGVVVGVIIYVLVALVLWLIYGTWNVYASIPLVTAVAVGLTVAIVNSLGKAMMEDGALTFNNSSNATIGRPRLQQPSSRLYNRNDEYVEDQ